MRNEPFTAERLEEQLKDQGVQFLSDAARFKIDRSKNRVHISAIFDWFGEDFKKTYTPTSGFGAVSTSLKPVLNYIALHVSERDAEYLRSGKYSVKYLDYDWSLNEQSK